MTGSARREAVSCTNSRCSRSPSDLGVRSEASGRVRTNRRSRVSLNPTDSWPGVPDQCSSRAFCSAARAPALSFIDQRALATRRQFCACKRVSPRDKALDFSASCSACRGCPWSRRITARRFHKRPLLGSIRNARSTVAASLLMSPD